MQENQGARIILVEASGVIDKHLLVSAAFSLGLKDRLKFHLLYMFGGLEGLHIWSQLQGVKMLFESSLVEVGCTFAQ